MISTRPRTTATWSRAAQPTTGFGRPGRRLAEAWRRWNRAVATTSTTTTTIWIPARTAATSNCWRAMAYR